MIDLEESYYVITRLEEVTDCDYGKGTEYRFEHNDKTFAVTIYTDRAGQLVGEPMLSLLDITEDIKHETTETSLWKLLLSNLVQKRSSRG